MKRGNHFTIAKAAVTLLFAVLTTTAAWAQGQRPFSGTGTEADPYQIATAEDWNTLADYVAAGNTCLGLFFKMTNNIGTTENPITKPIGMQVGKNKSDRMRFSGTFDGDNHTLTIALNTADNAFWAYNQGYCAPFAYTLNATFKYLHVAGSVTTTGTWASGLVGSTGGDNSAGTVNIDHCHISVAITANYESTNGSYGNHGGVVGIAEGNATITYSWFDGKFLGKDYMYSGGFIGINKGKYTVVSNCLFNPSEINIEHNNIEGSCEFVHSLNGGKHTLTNAYWVSHFGEIENAQGERVFANEPDANAYNYTSVDAADGHTYYIITGNKGWHAIEEAITNDASYTLISDVIAGNDDAALVIPNGKTFTLNMAGYTIDRNLTLGTVQPNGYVIKVDAGGTLIINGGTITGGNNGISGSNGNGNNSNGGGIYNAGTLNINGTTISGNYCKGHGAGIYNAGTLNIDDATITGNYGRQQANRGAGVYVTEDATLSMQGNVQINGNYSTYVNSLQFKDKHNLYRAGSVVITVTDDLTGSSFGIEGDAGVFTSGLSNHGNETMFSCDEPASNFMYVEGGEIYLAGPIDLSLSNDGDNTSAISEANGKPANVTLTGRTLYKDGYWNTICLPFDCKIANSPLSGNGVEARTLQSASLVNGTLTLTFGNKVDELQAGKPYIIKWTSGNNIYEPVFNKVIIKSGLSDVTSNNITIKGTYAKKIFTDNDVNNTLFLGDNNTLYYPNNGTYLNAQRAYFELGGGSANVKSFVLTFEDGEEDDVTGIVAYEATNNGQQTTDNRNCYDLFGRKVANPVKGNIYIVNGKKIVF